MGYIDVDTHVLETEATWSYVPKSQEHFKPMRVQTENGRWWWLVGDQRLSGGNPDVAPKNDPAVRLADMDRLGVEVQVLVPSFHLLAMIDWPDQELALARSYNRWMADITAPARGRLPWLVVPPLGTMNEALAELEFGKQHGAVGVLMRGAEHDKMLSDSYFFPLYDKAQELDLTISVHVGWTMKKLSQLCSGMPGPGAFFYGTVPVQAAIHSLLLTGTPARFPTLRWAFLEAGSQWLPFVLNEVARSNDVGVRTYGDFNRAALRDNRLYVACMMDEQLLPQVIEMVGEDNLVLGTDWGHNDRGTDLEGHRLLTERTDIPRAITQKIVDDNARRLFGLPARVAEPAGIGNFRSSRIVHAEL